MRQLLSGLLLIVFCPLPSPAQVAVRGQAVYAPFKKIVLKASDVPAKSSFQYLWDVEGDCDVVEAGDTLYVWAAPGTYKVTLTAVDFTAQKVERARFTFKVEGDVPIPPDPKPPDPKPPDPPTPKPPTPVVGMKVLILYDSKLKTTYGNGTLDVLHGQEMADWFNKNCSAESTLGYGKAWAVWPASVNADKMPTFWKDAVLRGRPKATGAKGPWLIVGDGGDRIVFEGELPPDVPSTVALLSKFLPSKMRKAG